MRTESAAGDLPGSPHTVASAARARLALGARHLPLAAVVSLAAVLRLWRLHQNGFGNEYYSAGVRSMATGWHNFFYCAFDPAGFLSVDKPPLALWLQVASVKLFGFHALSILAPQVVEGVAAVVLLHHLVRRQFGRLAGLLAALFLAVTPVSVAIDRSSNTDSCLVLVLLLAAWALMRAVERNSRGLLLVAVALIGLGFNVKMLAAFVVLPAFALVCLLGTSWLWRRRLADAVLAAIVLVAVSLPWALAYDLTPAERRPFVGSSETNSVLGLAIGHYGAGRFVRGARPASTERSVPASATPAPTAGWGSRNTWSGVFVRAPVGPLRLADGQLAGQTGWLFPLALVGLALVASGCAVRWPLAPAHLALLLWSGWALTYAIVYSYAGGIFHFYYMATMAPPLAALAGIGLASLWTHYLQDDWRAILLPTTLLLTAAWQLYVEASALAGTPDKSRTLIAALIDTTRRPGEWRTWLHFALLGGSLVAARGLAVASLRPAANGPARVPGTTALALGIVAILLLPIAWSLSSVLVPGHGVLPSASLSRLTSTDGETATRPRGRLGEPVITDALVAFLGEQRRGERYLLSTSSTMLAAPIIIATGEAVMARGGFHGLDPIVTPETLAWMVGAHEVRFAMLGDLSPVSRALGGEAAGKPVAAWIRAHGTRVDPTLWRPGADAAGPARRLLSRMQLYDLAPEAGARSR